MKRFIILTIAAVTLCNTAWGQRHIVADSIKVQIAKRDSLITSNTLKKDVLIDSLNAQICDYKRLMDVYEESISEKNANNDGLQEENRRLTSWLASDTSVFVNPSEIDDNVPVCLRKHISLIQKIGELADKIKSLEDKIADVQNNSPYATDEEKKIMIKRVIEADLNIIDKLFNEVADLDLSTLSEEQKKFYDPGLTERYNKFLIYFE
ncbi:MAG: hypothetical protein IJZ67_01385 [Alistipes sp.]|nr:hypothetical protein [Alistipes sp.]